MDIETLDFVNNYVKALKENNAVVFAGAGLSVSTGFFDWKKLMSPIADKLSLNIEEEHDLTALAQYYVDHMGGRGELNQVLVDQYASLDIKLSENHKILARLPISIFWTTNFDDLIEQSIKDAGKTPDIKRIQSDLSINLPKRDAIVYKMHGDITSAADAVITKHDYEDYSKDRDLFSNAFKSDFVARTFLFIGFSFTDPNLDYLISRIRSTLGKNKKPDYYFIKKETDTHKQKRQELRANSLKQYGLRPVWINDYSEIETILRLIETRYLRSSIFISGSADTYAPYTADQAVEFIHALSFSISERNYKIVSGFGLGIGSAVINGVLSQMQRKKNQNIDNYLVLRPFPQISSGGIPLLDLWKKYRETFIPLAGVAIFVFGNKNGGANLANGMLDEFDIAVAEGIKVIPIGVTGYVAEQLWQKVIDDFETYYPHDSKMKSMFLKLGDKNLTFPDITDVILKIVDHLNST